MKRCSGNPLAVQWLELRAFTAKGPGLIPGQGTKIPHAVGCSTPPPKKVQLHNKEIEIKTKYHVLVIKLAKTKIYISQYQKSYREMTIILHIVGMVGRKLVQYFGRAI